MSEVVQDESARGALGPGSGTTTQPKTHDFLTIGSATPCERGQLAASVTSGRSLFGFHAGLTSLGTAAESRWGSAAQTCKGKRNSTLRLAARVGLFRCEPIHYSASTVPPISTAAILGEILERSPSADQLAIAFGLLLHGNVHRPTQVWPSAPPTLEARPSVWDVLLPLCAAGLIEVSGGPYDDSRDVRVLPTALLAGLYDSWSGAGYTECDMPPMKNAESPEAYLAGISGWQAERARQLREVVLSSKALTEQVKWGHLVYSRAGPVCLIRAESERVLFGFWRGKQLREIEPRLEPGGKYQMATLKITEQTELQPKTLAKLVREAVKLNEALGDPTKLR